ncbi:MAG: hypothetical protein QG657_1579, partial [Acidobacteriota bacterium]|nr:hypothetical protein [Acidobacteriota bacterium]
YRSAVNSTLSFTQLLPGVKKDALACYEYQDFPFDLLVEQLEADRDLSRSPIFNVMIAHDNTDAAEGIGAMSGVEVSAYPHGRDFNMSKFDLIVFMDEGKNGVYTSFEYNSDLFERSTIERMAANFTVLVDHIIQAPDAPVSALDILSDEEYETVTRRFNDSRYEFSPLTLRELYEAQVRKANHKIAVIHHEDRITYGDLNKKANRIAHYLRAVHEAKPNDVIGISMDRSIDMIAVILGVIKSGVAYLAVDPTYPRDRVLHILTDSQAKLLVVDTQATELLGDYTGATLDIRAQWDTIEKESSENPTLVNRPTDILYVNYTSGSTGTPNGAMLTHDCLTNLIQWQVEKTGIHDVLKCLQFTSINFCVSFQEIMGTLTTGGELYLIGDVERQDIDYLMDFLSQQQIEILFLPFSYLNFLFNESGRWNRSFKHNLKHIITAGEQLKITAGLKRFLNLNPHLKLHNHYGSTEMHVVTSYTLDASNADATPIPPAGKPIDNIEIYILDENFNPVPVGVYGELCVVGRVEIAGYIGNKELTARKLISCPELSGIKLYRSGDIGRWLADGNIELRGRKDALVKVRGFRVEPGEIESKILSIEKVRECVVVVKEDNARQKYLAAYVSADGPDAVEIRRVIGAKLPQYMVPRIIMLDHLPLMPNGKVDRARLPEPLSPGPDENEITPPTNEVQQKLAEIWADLLGIPKERIGIDVNFFEVGGHSLKAASMMASIHKEFNAKVGLVDIFRNPTIRDIAGFIRELARDDFQALDAVEKKKYYPLTSAQKRLFVLQQMVEDNTIYNMPAMVELLGVLDKEKFAATFRRLVERHESLRTSFRVIDQEAVQRIHDHVEFQIEYLATDKHGQTRTFDLLKAPLLRVGLRKLEEGKHIVMVDMHHIISDGISLQILIREFMVLYNGMELPPLKLQYKDFAEWQHSAGYKTSIQKQENFWREQFHGEIPALVLPTDYTRPGVMDFAGSSVEFEIDTSALNALALEEQTTLFMVLIAIYYVFLARLCNQEDIVIGTPAAGRRHADLEGIIGMFVNTLVLRNFPAGEKTFKDFLSEIKENLAAAFDNQDYQYEALVEALAVPRDTNRNPLFDVMFTLHNLSDLSSNVEISGLKARSIKYDITTTRFDLTLSAIERGNNLQFILEYRTSLFKPGTAERFIVYLGNLLEKAARDKYQKLAEFEILPEEEKKRVLFDFNNTEAEYPEDKTIHKVFEEQVDRSPDHIGLVGPVKQVNLTYRQLNDQSDRLAGLLIEKGVLADNIVGIMIERSIEIVIGMLGILKAGGAYLPIDPVYPLERIEYMLKDSNAKLLAVANDEEGKKVRRWEGEKVFLEEISKSLNISSYPITFLPSYLLNPSNLAYTIYTSGTTGRPKGVLVQHRGLVNLVQFHREIFKTCIFMRASQVASQGFDAMAFEIWPCLSWGGVLHITPDEIRIDPAALKTWLMRYRITASFQPTAMVTRLLEEAWPVQGCLLQVIWTAGDKLTTYPAKKYPFSLYNLYGPTEDTVWTTWFETPVKPGTEQPPLIGTPIANHRVYILGKHLNQQPIGIGGEICISGVGLARGYLNQPELTAEKFNFNRSYRSYKTYILYKTGDLARWLIDGNIEFLGRIDQQVKIRGYRVELAEIEKQLVNIAAVKEAVVVDRDDPQGNKILAVYITCIGELDIPVLKKTLSRSLPHYMIPSFFMQVETIPLTVNGKVNRKALPLPDMGQGMEMVKPADEIEAKIAATWSEILGMPVDKISTGANFFDLGGHSLNAAIMTAKIHKEFDIAIPLVEIFSTPTVKGIAGLIKTIAWVNQESAESKSESGQDIVREIII